MRKVIFLINKVLNRHSGLPKNNGDQKITRASFKKQLTGAIASS
ncbi:hypothetical protein [Rubritalea tangerina]